MPARDQPDIPPLQIVLGERLTEGDVVWGRVIAAGMARLYLPGNAQTLHKELERHEGSVRFAVTDGGGGEHRPYFRLGSEYLIECQPRA